jgi:hypothetical protein
MRIGRSRVARGFDPTDDARPLDVSGSSSGLIGEGDDGSRGAGTRSGIVGAPSATIDAGQRLGSWADGGAPGTGQMRCHFLRSVEPDGRLADAQQTAVPTHRCAAYGDPLPLSLRQQELVCLQRVHVSCPRYVRGTLLANENQSQPASEDRRASGVPILSIAGFGLVGLAIAILVAAMLGIGPLVGGGPGHSSPSASKIAVASRRPSARPSPSTIVTASPTPASSRPASPTPTLEASPTDTPTNTPQPTPTPEVTPSPTAQVTPTPGPGSSWPPGATASRMSLVVPCTDQTDCYVYTVRGAGPPPSGNGSKVGDTVSNIARFFGVSIKRIYAMNPTASSGIRAGEQLRIPPPTR